MGSSGHPGRARPPLPPAVRAILWLDAVLLVAGALALAGKPPLLAHALEGWTGLALAGAGLTAASAAFAAFNLAVPGGSAWTWLPAPALALWLLASGADCFAVAEREDVWGDTWDETRQCLGFLLLTAAPLLSLILFMLRRAAPRRRLRAMALGGLASAGAAASLLALVHPHQVPLLDLGVHAFALTVIIAIGAAAGRVRRGSAA